VTDAEGLVRRVFDEVFDQRRFECLDDLFAAEYEEHAVAPFTARPPGRVHGPTHMRATVEWLVAQFPDVTMTIAQIVAQPNLVAARVVSEGTNLGPINGVIPPTGKRFRSEQSHWYSVADGRLAQHWATRDDLATMVQLGVIGRPGPPPG
jgi:predicted ester cyclase